jgi:hypothetical protein
LGESLTIMDSDSYKDHGGNAKLVRIDGWWLNNDDLNGVFYLSDNFGLT